MRVNMAAEVAVKSNTILNVLVSQINERLDMIQAKQTQIGNSLGRLVSPRPVAVGKDRNSDTAAGPDTLELDLRNLLSRVECVDTTAGEQVDILNEAI